MTATATDPGPDAPELPLAAVPAERRCAYTRCREPLPPPSPTGRPRRYCPSRTHDTVDGRQVSCRQAGQAEELLTALHGAPALPATGLTRVAELISTVMPTATELVTLLTQVERQLTDDVAVARTERDAALAVATEAQEAREQALVLARDAREKSGAAGVRAEAAERERAEAVAGAATAREGQVRAEARLGDAMERAATADAAAREAQGHAATADRRLAADRAAAQASLAELRDALSRARETHAENLERLRAQERERLEAAHLAAATQLAEARARHEAALVDVRETADTEVRRATAAIEAARGEHRREQRRHIAELAELHRRIGEHQAREAVATERAEVASADLTAWRRELVSALSGSGADPARLRSAVEGVVSPPAAPAEDTAASPPPRAGGATDEGAERNDAAPNDDT